MIEGSEEVYYNPDFNAHINAEENVKLLRAVARQVNDKYKVSLTQSKVL